jgi:hypothetical protein
MKNGRFGKNPCEEEGCKCENYKYMFRRPEEIGQYFLTRRKGRVIILTIDYSHCFCWKGLM